jgi:hypothetical protein
LVKLKKIPLQKYFDPNGVKDNISSCEFSKNSASSGIKIADIS